MKPSCQPLPKRPRSRFVAGSIPAALLITLTCSAWHTTVWADAVRFRVQPEASRVAFKATSRLMNAEGRFPRLSGEIVVDPTDPATGRVTLSIEAGSIDTGIGMRDSHLRSEDFLDIRKFPTIAFESQRIEGSGRRLNVIGQLSIHGVTREIAVPVEVSVTAIALVASGEFVINRHDYGIDYQSFLNPIGDDVRVSFTISARSA